MADFIEKSHVFLDNPSTTRAEVLEFLSAKAAELGFTDDISAVYAAFQARELEGSTGMMRGFAIPHAKTNAIKEARVFVVKFASAVEEWTSLDSEPIRVAIALLVPDDEAKTTHLELLSNVAVMLMRKDFCRAILDSSCADEIAKIINDGLDE